MAPIIWLSWNLYSISKTVPCTCRTWANFDEKKSQGMTCGQGAVAIVTGKAHRGSKFPLLLPKGSISVVLFKYNIPPLQSKVQLWRKLLFLWPSKPNYVICPLAACVRPAKRHEAGVHSTPCALANTKACDCVSMDLVWITAEQHSSFMSTVKTLGDLNLLFKIHSTLADLSINSYWNDFLRLLAREQSYLQHMSIKIEPKEIFR